MKKLFRFLLIGLLVLGVSSPVLAVTVGGQNYDDTDAAALKAAAVAATTEEEAAAVAAAINILLANPGISVPDLADLDSALATLTTNFPTVANVQTASNSLAAKYAAQPGLQIAVQNQQQKAAGGGGGVGGGFVGGGIGGGGGSGGGGGGGSASK
jgi:uncharacterized membrane protein YgcG